MSNDSKHWRKFEEAELTHSAAHYLMAILNLRKKQGYARITDVADYLSVSRGAASKAIALLRDRDFICEDPNRMLELTSKGFEVVHTVERNFTVVEAFFKDILEIESAIARENACKLEHLLSSSVTESLFRFVRVLEENPKLMEAIKRELESTGEQCGKEASGICPVCGEYDGCIEEELKETSTTESSQS